jgi:hypothetical protein
MADGAEHRRLTAHCGLWTRKETQRALEREGHTLEERITEARRLSRMHARPAVSLAPARA